MMKTCAVIYNPISGKKVNFSVMPQFEKILADYGYESKIIYTKYKGHATEIVESVESTDLVISIGGDGTFNESVTGNFMRKNKLVCAHIPCGTTNDIGVMMGYGKNMINNLKLTLDGVVKNVDICMINDILEYVTFLIKCIMCTLKIVLKYYTKRALQNKVFVV